MILFDRIVDEIFVGTCPGNNLDIQRLGQAGFTSVLNLQTDIDFSDLGIAWTTLESLYHTNGIAVYRFPIVDHDDNDLCVRLPAAATLLSEILTNHDRVYVHCTAGLQRSPSTVIGYLSWHRDMSLQLAIEMVKSARSCDPPLSVIQNADTMVRKHGKRGLGLA